MDTLSRDRWERPRRQRRGPTPTHHRVSDQLRQAIVSGEYLDGERLVVDELSRRYDTSAMPVRQALQQLQGEGLVVATQNRGARVRRVDPSLAENLYDLRRAIFALLVERCIERITDESLAELILIEQRGRDARTTENRFTTHEAFLSKIGEIADIPQAEEVMDRTWPLMCAVRRVYGGRDHRIDRRRLLEAIERRNVADAVAVIVQAAREAKADLIERIAGRDENETARPRSTADH